MRRRMMKNKNKEKNQNQEKFKSFNNIVGSKNISMMSVGRNTLSSYSGKDRLKEDNRNSLNISLLKPKKNYLIKEETNLFEKYFSSLTSYFRELTNEKKVNTIDKILKLRQVLDINISIF